jgi:glutamyl-tRNA synthetase
MRIRVRFAPSPTGELHVGGARTAVFNWLYAKKNNGEFLLRIEDTDRERSSEKMTERILEGLSWLGLDWSDEPVYQSKRIEKHLENAYKMESSGSAYKCFCSLDRLQNEREEALKNGTKSWKYPGYCRNLSSQEVDRRIEQGDIYSVRFRVPEGTTEYVDLVHGEMSFENSNIDDFILLRSDLSPTYQLSVVSDDISMGITHIIRGDDHISNTPKQILIYKALGSLPPQFAHIPLILGKDKKRLSKRHGATSLIEYRDKGYLSEAMFNFLSLLGWSPGNNKEFMQLDEIINEFSFSGVNKSGSVFDEQKLEWLNGQHISSLPARELADKIIPVLKDAGLWSDSFLNSKKEWFYNLIDLVKTRCRFLHDFARDMKPYISDDFTYDPVGVQKHLKSESLIEALEKLEESFTGITEFNLENSESALRNVAEMMEISAGKLIHPLRMALVGVPVSPGVFDVAVFLGKQKTLDRIEQLIKWLKKMESGK